MSEAWRITLGSVDWAAVAVLLPLAAAAAAFICRRPAGWICLAATVIAGGAGAALVASGAEGGADRQSLGGWMPPLGIAWRADGVTALMIAMTGLVGTGVAAQMLLSARSAAAPTRSPDAARSYYPLWLLLLAGLNALYLSADLFNLYVTIEIVGLAAVGLTAGSGRPEALAAAMRYLLVGLFASLLYLLGVVLIYAQYGALDIETVRNVMRVEPASQLAFASMFAGLALKSALFPLHFWLPPAHGNATPAVSAILSALVVKGSLYIMLRLWLDLFEPAGVATRPTAVLLGALGSAAVIWGSLQALLAERMKLLVAYSTVAQLGYFFLFFPLAGAGLEALSGAMYIILAHAFAKSAMFLACGEVYRRLGHDQVGRLARSPPLPRLLRITIVLAALSLVGFPPSGGFVGKWLLLSASLDEGISPWSGVVIAGTLLSAAAMLRIVASFFARHPEGEQAGADGARVGGGWTSQIVPLILASVAIGLGAAASGPLSLIELTAHTR